MVCGSFWTMWITDKVLATCKSWSNVGPLYFWHKPWLSSHQDSGGNEGVRISLLAWPRPFPFVIPVLFMFYPGCSLLHLTLLWLVPVMTSACKQPRRMLSAAAHSSALTLVGLWIPWRMWWKPWMLSQQNIQTHNGLSAMSWIPETCPIPQGKNAGPSSFKWEVLFGVQLAFCHS